ncbi:MAG: hypothetical protein KKE02_15310 [Alphaproteobacteria bacterium]|nr:hypothetical protein [Alphaproteobacteria bacterium]MBU1516788.1 hypothetical protein [Alphaproteobacteria bacterium]MBU2092482.1 hypothetical protein [Alphaproteobacteria bacterium]MBU2152387.1 hypothetical protein [Alphaproteobacteria bacterium]MBU2305598.1 hypothetical protein [Alphaproteobacteria bacterium]
MWLAITVPSFNLATADVRVARIHIGDGVRAARGQAVFDLTVDLSGGAARECPPVSTCRIVLREEAWLRRVCVEVGAKVTPGQTLALLSIEPDAPTEPPAREARVTAATMLHQADLWFRQA